MKIFFTYILLICFFLTTKIYSKENFFYEAKKLYDKEKFEDSKFLFQRNIVFNPKHAESYLFLAKIYNFEENEFEEEKNLDTVLLLEPKNEEALYMLINIKLKRSNYSKVRDLTKSFEVVCLKLCEKIEYINENLKDIEAKNES